MQTRRRLPPAEVSEPSPPPSPGPGGRGTPLPRPPYPERGPAGGHGGLRRLSRAGSTGAGGVERRGSGCPLAPPPLSPACSPGDGRLAEGKAAIPPQPCEPQTAVLRCLWVLLAGLPLPRHGPWRRTARRAPQPPRDPLRVPVRGSPPPPRAWPSALQPEGRGGSPLVSCALFMAGSALCPRAPNVTCSSRCVTSPSCNGGGGGGGDGASGRDAFCNISN